MTQVESQDRQTYETAPKLFSKWPYDPVKVPRQPLRSTTNASSIISPSTPINPTCSSLTLLAATNKSPSERQPAQSLRGSSVPSSSTAGTQERRLRPSESCATLLKSSTCSLAETHSKYSLGQSSPLVLERTPQESDLEVLLESRQ